MVVFRKGSVVLFFGRMIMKTVGGSDHLQTDFFLLCETGQNVRIDNIDHSHTVFIFSTLDQTAFFKRAAALTRKRIDDAYIPHAPA